MVSDLIMGNFCSTIAANISSILPDGAAHLRSTELYSSPEGKHENGSALVASFGLGFFRNSSCTSKCCGQMDSCWEKESRPNTDGFRHCYVDSMGAALNPEMVEIERGGCVGREALLFGHIYEEGEGGRVMFGKIRVGEGGFIGSRAIVMPGVRVERGGNLSALSLAMKEEIVRSG
ncbi:hypothetical protein OIU84_003386 [Salix udensis]|uniref:Uncharacterized protein n=1 Tax=Salix udensis TaxID=889485 RepID=A0AAD6K0R6_9ROSI|nr:hypothetical protein OIU84_003386 [Salix udensis]